MASFEKRTRRANWLFAGITIAGIVPSVWLGMLFVKSGEPVYSGIVFAELVEYTSVFIAYMLTRKGQRLWQTLKYIVSASFALAFIAVPWAGIFLAPCAGLISNGLVCLIGYAISPALKFEDKVHHAIVWSGGKDAGKVRSQVESLLRNKLTALLPRYKKLLSRADKLASKGEAGLKKAQRIFLKLIAEVEEVPRLSQEGKQLLGRAYLGLGTAQRTSGQRDKAIGSYVKAKSYGVWDAALDSVLAVSYARGGNRTPGAIESYLAYLKQRCGEALDEEKKIVLAVLEKLGCFTDEEIVSLARDLSRKLALKAIGEKTTSAEANVPSIISDIRTLDQKVVEADPGIVWAHLHLGLACLFYNEPMPALAELERTELSTGKPLIAYYQGLAYASMNNTDKALPLFEKSAAGNPQHADSQFHTGRLLLLGLPAGNNIFVRVPFSGSDEQRLKGAISFLHRALELCSDRGDYYLYAGLAHYKAGEYTEAGQELSRVIVLEPEWKESYYLLALVQRELREYQGARDSLQELIKLSATYQPAYSLLGQVYFEQRDWKSAASNCRKAVQMDSADSTARSVLGRALFFLNKYSEAADELGQLSQPQDSEVLYCLGRSLMKIDRFREAIPVLTRLSETDQSAFYLLGCACANLGNQEGDYHLLDTAITWFDRATEATEPPPEVYLQRANARLSRGQVAEAYEDLKRSLALKPQDADVAYALGIYYHKLGDNEKALAELHRATAINSNHAPAYFAQGQIKEMAGDLPAAAECYSLALGKTKLPEVQLRLGIVHCKSGDDKQAIADLSRARELGSKSDALGYYLGWAYAMVSSYDKAIEEWEGLLQKHTEDWLVQNIVIVHHRRAQQLFSNRDYEGSIHHWDACLKILGRDGRSPLALPQHLAEACFRQGVSYLRRDGEPDYQKARELLQKAVDLNGESMKYRYYLALTDLGGGDINLATSRLEDLLNTDHGNRRYQYPLALALVRRGEYEQAMSLLQCIIESDHGRRYGASFVLADCYRALGKWDEAAGMLKVALGVEVG